MRIIYCVFVFLTTICTSFRRWTDVDFHLVRYFSRSLDADNNRRHYLTARSSYSPCERATVNGWLTCARKLYYRKKIEKKKTTNISVLCCSLCARSTYETPVHIIFTRSDKRIVWSSASEVYYVVFINTDWCANSMRAVIRVMRNNIVGWRPLEARSSDRRSSDFQI